MNTVDGFKGIMALELDNVPRIFHDALIKQHKQDIVNYKNYQASLPEELRYENNIGNALNNIRLYDKIRHRRNECVINEAELRYKELLEKSS
tara:strand:- start:1505 stop:1780 length:276 start_codon:yes stop_codon:yes gene_type:complete